MVKGVSSMKIAISPCCSPVYGDKIVGFVSKGQGIKVHRADCPNIANERRLIDVEWDPQKPDIRYEASIKIFSKDRSYLLTDLVTVVAQYKANLTAVNSQANAEDLSATTSMSSDSMLASSSARSSTSPEARKAMRSDGSRGAALVERT